MPTVSPTPHLGRTDAPSRMPGGRRQARRRWAWLAARLGATQSNAVVLWLPREAWAGLGDSRWTPVDPVRLYLSSTLLHGELVAVPETLRRFSTMIHPFAPQRRIRRLEGWLASRGLALVDQPVQAQTYFACLIASEGLKRTGEHLYRDYFLEGLDRLSMAPIGSGFPGPAFAPNRRYLINGAYMLAVGEKDGVPTPSALWIVPSRPAARPRPGATWRLEDTKRPG